MSEQRKKESAFQLFEKSEVLKNLKSELKIRWLNRIDVNSVIPIESQVQSLEREMIQFNQISANNQNYSGFPPRPVNNQPSYQQKIIDDVLDNMTGFTK